jgi:hypothetical protein
MPAWVIRWMLALGLMEDETDPQYRATDRYDKRRRTDSVEIVDHDDIDTSAEPPALEDVSELIAERSRPPSSLGACINTGTGTGTGTGIATGTSNNSADSRSASRCVSPAPSFGAITSLGSANGSASRREKSKFTPPASPALHRQQQALAGSLPGAFPAISASFAGTGTGTGIGGGAAAAAAAAAAVDGSHNSSFSSNNGGGERSIGGIASHSGGGSERGTASRSGSIASRTSSNNDAQHHQLLNNNGKHPHRDNWHVFDPVYGVIPRETRDLWAQQEESSRHRRQLLIQAALQEDRKPLPPVRNFGED